MTTEAPAVTATKKPMSTAMICEARPPTAARATVPTKRPTISPSTVLYSCWMQVPAAMGRKNTIRRFHTVPVMRSLCRSRAAMLFFLPLCKNTASL